MSRRTVELVVISDVHLGTFGLHADELLKYLKSIKPDMLILNGDIIDIWNFKKRFFPKKHLRIIYELIKLSQKGTKVIYLTGNHDDLLRTFGRSNFGSIKLRDHLKIDIKGKRYWFFHGDIFDRSIQQTKWLAKLGGKGYDFLIYINRLFNRLAKFYGRAPFSFSAKIKNNVKKAVKYISDFEQAACDVACDQGFDFVVCGHIHMPIIKTIRHSKKNKFVKYMNSGDWVENLSALEFDGEIWKIFRYYEPELQLRLKKIKSIKELKVPAPAFN